jgi:gas vesicle protein
MDPIAVGGLIVGAIGAVAAVVGAVAAIYAARYAKDSPTKEDLERVEANTAETAKHIDAVRDHLKEQNRRELLESQAEQLSISVTARNTWEDPLKLILTLKERKAVLLRIDLLNNRNMLSGTFDCEEEGPLIFTAKVAPEAARSWFGSGDRTDNFNLMRLQIRAFFSIDGPEANRTFSVHLARVQIPIPGKSGGTETAWQLDGKC